MPCHRLFGVTLALACVASPVAGQQHVSVPQLFARADEERTAGRLDDAAAIYRALAHDPDLVIRTEARFRHGMMLAHVGRRREAATLFRALLDEQPAAPRVRLELARLLAELGDEGAARRELRQAQAAGLPPDVARVVDQFATALRSYRPYGASVEIAVAPDSNVNRATEARTLDTVIAPLDLTRDARARSGLGIKLSGQAFARFPVSPRLALLPRVSGSGDLYRAARFNDVSSSFQLGLERQSIASGRLTVSAGRSWRWYAGDPYATTTTLGADWLRPLSRADQLTLSASTGPARYRQNDQQDGWLYDATIGYERALTARSGATLSLNGNRQDARDAGYATTAAGLSGLYFREVGRTTAFGSVTVRHLEADQRLFLFAERRRDWLGRVSVGATFRQVTVGGFAPVVRLTAERNRSTVGLYDYHRLAAEIGIGRAF